MCKYLLIITTVIASIAHAAYPTPSVDAQVLVNRLNPVNCNEKAGGFYCYIKVNSKLVTVIVPRSMKATGECLVHFHGFRYRSDDATPHQTIEYFNFADTLNSVSPTTLMIAPVGAFGSDNYDLDDNYASVSKVQAMLDGVAMRTGETCEKIILSGHSAAYLVLGPLMRDINAKPTSSLAKKVSNLFLFDTLYSSNLVGYNTWITDSSSHWAFNVSLPGGSTRSNSLNVVSSPRYKNYLSTVSNHWNLVRDKYFGMFLGMKAL